MEYKKLYRSQTNKIIGGVCGGLGEYLKFDPTILRIIWVFVVIITGLVPGVLVYILALLIIPVEGTSHENNKPGI